MKYREFKKKYNKVYRRMMLTVVSGALFIIFLLLNLLAFIVGSGKFDFTDAKSIWELGFILISIMLIFLSQLLATYWVKRISKPVEDITKVTQQVSQGNFDVRVNTDNFKDEMLELGNTINKMIDQLNSIEILRSDFVSNVSHEFKAPLSAIQGYVTLMSKPDLSNEKRAEYFTLLSQSVAQMSGLVDNVLKLSKLESDSSTPKKTVFRLDEQLRRSVLMFEKQWMEKDLEPELELQECTCNGNEELLGQIWTNLIGNAIKFSHSGGRFGVKIDDTDEKFIAVTVFDEGEGMSEEVKEHIFEKFYQGDTSHKAMGNGLGLALVAAICNLTGCTVSVESEVGKGSEFTVKIPR
ncbi:MAG: HAMP domain-containing histidine kinase [Clostridia bacterium]|nr:HAMP domain-containing histidine kinase [Clostridia bacterium]